MSSSNINFDASLVDWLYGELSTADAKRFEKHLESHPEDAAEAEAMRQLRVCVRELDEAEPPDALTTILMHEAACQAKSEERSDGLWAAIVGFFQPVFLHPAASAMASLVLVVGVAGVLYMRKGSDMIAEPTASSSAAAPAEVSPEKLARAETSEESDFGQAASGEPVEDQAAVAELSAAESDEEAPSAKADKGFAGDFDDAIDGRSARVLDVEGERRLAVASDAPKRVNKRESPAKTRLRAGSKKPLPSAPSTNAVTGSNRLFDSNLAGGIASSSPTSNKAAKKSAAKIVMEEKSWEDNKASSFRLAAKSKRCREAGRIANDIRDRKPGFYRTQIEGTKEESDCRYSIVSENKRRVKQRVARKSGKSKKQGTRKQGSSVPKKAVAAPQEDAVSESAESF